MIFIFNAFIVLVSYATAQGNDTIVSIKNGKILGSRNFTVDMHKLYYSFRGIPYAEPPVKTLRFSPPVPAKKWSGILNATRDGEICTQGILKIKGSENCLFINVYTTNLNRSASLPVMFWIYGGTFLTGSSLYTEYGPDYFLDQDVIVVSFNYRLGIFGFLSTEDAVAPGNWGLKDQALALKWVNENIENFGGDPKKVTIFGESAGSVSVSYLVQTNITKGLFRGAIMESGTSLNPWALSGDPMKVAFSLGVFFVKTNSSTALINTLRDVDYKLLQFTSSLVYIGETVFSNPLNSLQMAPVNESISRYSIVVNKSHQKLKEGDYNRVPMIVGFNSQEGLPFAEVLEKLRIYLLTFDIIPTRLIPEDMNINSSDTNAVATKIKSHYFENNLITLSNTSLLQFITDTAFVRSINEAVRLMSNYNKVYYYRFSYTGRLGLSAATNKNSSGLGVGHAEELNYLWRRSSNIQNPSSSDLLIRRRVIKLWTNFAKTLNPTPVRDSLFEKVIWTPATPKVQSYLDIGNNMKIQTNLSQYSIDWWRQLYKDYGHPPYGTY